MNELDLYIKLIMLAGANHTNDTLFRLFRNEAHQIMKSRRHHYGNN